MPDIYVYKVGYKLEFLKYEYVFPIWSLENMKSKLKIEI